MILVCCGMIRSGSTLQYNMARSLVEASGLGRGEGFVDDPHRDQRLRQWCWDKTWHVVKMHRLVEWMLEDQARKSIRFLFCHRNLRDVAASAKRKFSIPNSEIWQRIDEAILIQKRLQGADDTKVQRYCDLVDSPSECLEHIAAFLDLAPSEQVKSHILASCSLASAEQIQSAVNTMMSAQGIKADDTAKISVFDQTTLLHHNHISASRGQDGAWHADLTASDLQMIDGRYREWLKTEGYLKIQ